MGPFVAWGPGINPNDLPNDAFVVVDNSTNPSPSTGAVYKGATIAQMETDGPLLQTILPGGGGERYGSG